MINLHPVYGVNPLILNCYYCNAASELALIGQPRSDFKAALEEAGAPVGPDGEAPRRGVVIDNKPCHRCSELMKQGIIMISVDVDKTTDPRNPYRTGGWCVVTDAYVSKVLQAEVALPLLKNRVAFVPDDVWDEVGLPRGSM